MCPSLAGGPIISGSDLSLAELLSEVAGAVGLAEGDAGVRRVLIAIRQLAPASTRSVSRQTGLPVPVVAAVNNELRARGVVTRDRPSRLTDNGLALLADLGADLAFDGTCADCAGHGVAVPPALAGLVDQLAGMMAGSPAVDLTLDQSHCTAETKVRRILLLVRYGLLPGDSLLIVGDDDLMAIAVAAAGAALGRPLVKRLAMVDIADDIIDFTQDRLGELDTRAELVRQDLRDPLDRRLVGGFDLAMTDPPYTVDGARLFLSRAVDGFRPGPGRGIAFSFGPKSPDDALLVQEAVTELGLTVQAMHRSFNEYVGAGIIGGTSHLQYLTTTARTAPVVDGVYTGPMYTADRRTAQRAYQCLECNTRLPVGRGSDWPTIAHLKAARCPNCGGERFRPLQLITETRT